MPNERAKELLTDIGTEELGHLEVIATLVYKLDKDATPEQMRAAGLGSMYADHEKALFYVDAGYRNLERFKIRIRLECKPAT